MMKNLLIFTLLFFTFSSQNAFAYIDPGTGSAIISAIIGFFVVFGVIIKSYFYKIKSFFIKDKSNKNNKD
jgi:hypothetical protein